MNNSRLRQLRERDLFVVRSPFQAIGAPPLGVQLWPLLNDDHYRFLWGKDTKLLAVSLVHMAVGQNENCIHWHRRRLSDDTGLKVRKRSMRELEASRFVVPIR